MTRFRPYLAALLVLLGMVGATLWSAWGQRQTMLESSRAQFSLESRDLADNLREVLNTYAGIMRAGVGLLAVNPDTRPSEWKRFVASLDLPNEFPGVQGVGFASVVERSQADGGVRQTPSGDMTTSIMMLEPEDWRNQRAIGFDMFSEETRQVAMGRARDTGTLALSGGVTLVQESGDSVQRGLLMYMPVYEGNGDPENVADRRRLLRGYVYSAYRVGDLINKALTNRNPQAFRNIRMRVYDSRTAQQDRLLFDSRLLLTDAERQVAEGRPASVFTQGVTIIVGGQPLHMELSSRVTFEDRIDWAKPRAQLAGGLVISLLMAGIVGGLAYARDKSRQGEARLMREITERTRAQEQALLANRELIHRVKNTLAIVNAIASQTARHTGNMTDFTRAFRERLSALGRVHDLLRPDRAGNP
ncbi:MAG: CHASE domain-containing protein, partial [Beijerinckiaceae bacterium]